MGPINDDDRTRERLGAESSEPIRLASGTLGKYRHVCAFFHNPEEEYRVLLPFIKEGLARGEKAFHILDPTLQDEHRRQLEAAGIDVSATEQRGQLQVCHWHEMYLRDGRFDRDRMLACLREVFENGPNQGFPLTRVTGHAEWAGEGWPGVDDFLEYECRLNYILTPFKDAVICLFDLSKCRGNLVIDVMRTHPMTIIGGILQENPFFVPPDEFLQELRGRKSIGKVAQT
jgi:hypothetical protein